MAEMTVKRIESKEELFALLEENNNEFFATMYSAQDRHGDAHYGYGKFTWEERDTRWFENPGKARFYNINGRLVTVNYENMGNPELALKILLERLEAFIESGKRETVYRYNAFEKGSMRVSSR